MSKKYTLREVAQHNKEGDSWLVIDGKVYDVSKFAKFHPGGKAIIHKYAGQEVSNLFKVFHNPDVMRKYGPRFLIGEIEGGATKKMHVPGTFGDMVAYGDPLWYQRFHSPYYKETHRVWRQRIRTFVDTEIIPTMDKWKEDGQPPADLVRKMGKEGFLAACTGAGFPKEYLDSDVPVPEDFDCFHELILYDEISRCGHSGVVAALTNGPAIALSAVLSFGSDKMKKQVVGDVLMGRKYIALAISEAAAGSDVAGLLCEGKRVGNEYIVNGTKKWITNGMYADYFVTAVKTGARQVLTFLLVDADTPGFSRRKLAIRGSDVSGTAFLEFDNVKVPVENRIGEENKGFKLVMHNFNHERFYVTACALRHSRVCLEECIKYAVLREAFGKKLADQPVIRAKIAQMAKEIESCQSWLENVTYQLCRMSKDEANQQLGDVICLLKSHASKVYEYCARETTMIFGGNSMYMDGPGKKIEPVVGQVKAYQIPAGAPDVMDDFGARVAFKRTRLLAKF